MRRVDYAGAKMRDLTLAWATTVHKAQGGESPIVVLLLSLEHGQMLTRRLLYTGIPASASAARDCLIHIFL